MSKTTAILPPATIGIIGGGQLGQMLALSAKSMGYKVGILEPTADAPAAQVSDFQVVAAYDDPQSFKQFSDRCDVVTFEFENVSPVLLGQLPAQKLPQGVDLLAIAADRWREKQFIAQLGLPTAPTAPVTDDESFQAAIVQVGMPAILKTRHGGYDGHGQVDVVTAADQKAARQLYTVTPCVLEARVTFDREVSMMVTRTVAGTVRTFPITENQHVQHILRRSVAPAILPPAVAATATAAATKIAMAAKLRGVLGIEFFVTPTDDLIVNELAPRPHNSGHYSIEACNVSQFEAHIRSICGLPVPEIEQKAPAVMLNLLGDGLLKARQALIRHPDWHFHDYGKSTVRPQRKLGHLTLLGATPEAVLEKAHESEREVTESGH